MDPVLILREEAVCLMILLFLAGLFERDRTSREGRLTGRLLECAILHVVLEGAVVLTAHPAQQIPQAVHYGLHLLYDLSLIGFAQGIFQYTVRRFAPEKEKLWRNLGLAVLGGYIVLLPWLGTELAPGTGASASTGLAAWAGAGIASFYFFCTLGMLIRHGHRMEMLERKTLVLILLVLLAAETAQVLLRAGLFTGGAITIAMVGLFFMLGTPSAVAQRKAMVDAMTGVENRNSYEADILEYDRQYLAHPETQFTFLFADINNLKSVNGMFGHDEGDAYISFIAQTIRTTLKGAEHIYRMGGDEFLAVYRDMEEQVILRGIEQIREACAREAEQKPYTPLLAIGYAISGPQYKSLHDVLRVADYMMYQNKAALKRESVEETSHRGTKLNLTGLTDRAFDAMCASGEGYYPFLQNLETGVTRVAPGLAEIMGTEEFLADFDSVWLKMLNQADQESWQKGQDHVRRERQPNFDFVCMARNLKGHELLLEYRVGLYHGRDGEPDTMAGYVLKMNEANKGSVSSAS